MAATLQLFAGHAYFDRWGIKVVRSRSSTLRQKAIQKHPDPTYRPSMASSFENISRSVVAHKGLTKI